MKKENSFVTWFKRVFGKKTKEELFIENEMKKLENRINRSICMAEYAGSLAQCKAAFQQTIMSEAASARQRRSHHIGDSVQKQQIHDAVVGILAVEEAGYELKSLENIQDMNAARDMLNSALRKMYKINHYLSINGQEVSSHLDMEFDDTYANLDFTSRAELVDEKFVEALIQGETVEYLLQKVNKAGDPGTPDVDNSQPLPDYSIADDEKAKEEAYKQLKKDADNI